MPTNKLGWRQLQWSFYLSLNDTQKILGYGASQMVCFLKTFSWTLTLYIRISNIGGSAWERKKIVHLVCVVKVKLEEAADIFAAMDFDRKFAGSRCWKVLSTQIVSVP